jgi:hypothetical protein
VNIPDEIPGNPSDEAANSDTSLELAFKLPEIDPDLSSDEIQELYQQRLKELINHQQIIEERVSALEAREVLFQEQFAELQEQQSLLQQKVNAITRREEILHQLTQTETYRLLNARELKLFLAQMTFGLWEDNE